MTIQFHVTFVREPLTTKTGKQSDIWQDNSYQWRVMINGEIFDYYTGRGLFDAKKHTPKKPTVDDVLYSLLGDSEAENMTFDDWCANFGYDSDSRKALETYIACQNNAKKLRRTGINIEAEKIRLQDY